MIKWFKAHVVTGLSVITGIITATILLIGYASDLGEWWIDRNEDRQRRNEALNVVDSLDDRLKMFEDSAFSSYVPQFQYVLEEIPKVSANDFRSRILLDVVKGTLKDSVINGIRFKSDDYKRLWYFKNGFVHSAYYEAESRKYLYRDMYNNLLICE